MPKLPSRRIQVLSCLTIADAATFDALLPVLTKKDLVRLVGLLQQSMLEEQRRFTQLSQCLQTLIAAQSAAVIPAISGKDKDQDDDDEDSANSHSVSNDADESSATVKRQRHLSSGHCDSILANLSEGESRLSSNASMAELLYHPTSSDESEFAAKLSIQWDNAQSWDEIHSSAQLDGAILRMPIGDSAFISDDDTSLDNFEARMRAEQLHRDYLARELCLSQSRLAQLCAKNMKIFNLQEQHRQRYGLDGYQDEFQDQVISPTQQQQRKSLSTLHKERKLKELSEISNQATTTADQSPSKTDLLRQQAFKYVLTDIFSGNGTLVAANPLVRAEISPESGYNSSSSLKSPPSATDNAASSNQPHRHVQPNPTKPNEVELRASRERILEQVRSRRSSAPPVQRFASDASINRTSNSQSQFTSVDQQRPLKSILKKRQPENECSRSSDVAIFSNDHRNPNHSSRSPSKKDSSLTNRPLRFPSGASKRNSSGSVDVGFTSSNVAFESKMAEKTTVESPNRISIPDSGIVYQRSSPVPLMAERPGPSVHSIPDSPGPFQHVDYPSPTKSGSPTIPSTNGKSDLPDVVVSKLGSTQLQSPQGSIEGNQISQSPKILEPLEKPRMKEFRKTSREEESTATEYDAFREWDPRPLLLKLYEIDYGTRPEEKRQRFINMEGHLEHLPMNIRAIVATDTMWRRHYFRTKEGKLQWFEAEDTDAIPFGEMSMAGAEVDVDKNACILVLKNPTEGLLTIRYPPDSLDKWRAAILNHASALSTTNFVRPVYPPIPFSDQKICVIEIGSCSIRAGLLTTEASLPQSYFPSIACVLPDGNILPGFDALSPSVRHDGTIVHPITPTQLSVNRYSIELEIVKHLFRKVFEDLRIQPGPYQVMLSVPQNAPVGMVGDMMRSLLTDFSVQGVSVSRQPFLILYAYDVTTGVVVDIGDRLNIVPVIDGYVVQSAIFSLPYGGHNVSEALRSKLIERNWTPYSFISEVEKYLLRYVMQKTCYVAADFDEEAKHYDHNQSSIDKHISIEQFHPTSEMPKGFDVDAARFTSTEGIFKPKRWGFDIDGLHKLIYNAIQGSPLDSRRILYRNIYLAGGASLLPGLVERLESELTPLVASSVQVRVRASPWRDHAAYIGAQILAGGIQFEQQLIKDTGELDKFIRRLQSANF